jgi:hypothetical protein
VFCSFAVAQMTECFAYWRNKVTQSHFIMKELRTRVSSAKLSRLSGRNKALSLHTGFSSCFLSAAFSFLLYVYLIILQRRISVIASAKNTRHALYFGPRNMNHHFCKHRVLNHYFIELKNWKFKNHSVLFNLFWTAVYPINN